MKTKDQLIIEKQDELIKHQEDYINWINLYTPEAKESRRGDNILTDIKIIKTKLAVLKLIT